MMQTNQTNALRARFWGRVTAVLITVAFTGSALSKLAHVPKVIEGLTRAGIPESAIAPIAILELTCLALYLFPRTSILGTFLLTGYMGGAIVTHIIGGQTLLPPMIVGVLMFASSYLRNAELRKLLLSRNLRLSAANAAHFVASVPGR